MNEKKLREVRDFLRLKHKEQEDLRTNQPQEFDRLMDLKDEVWSEWQEEFSNESFSKSKTGSLIKVIGGKEHPFERGLMISYHKIPGQVLARTKRGTVKEPEIRPQEAEQIGRVLKRVSIP
jgi:hypothetical protein